ncbi:MAG TPA: MotA/TolQ/ExbB proton channel family protein [Geminicoccaceae bacterium]|nr:MotA/TolQ/ExbB proton channel family protein [Geminicoccaceae bacterium]
MSLAYVEGSTVAAGRGATTAAPAAHGPPLEDRAPAQYRYLLLLRFALLNLTGLALLGAAWSEGWLDAVVASDITRLSTLIFAVFLVGLVWTAQKVSLLSHELNSLTAGPAGGPSRALAYLESIRGTDSTARATLASALRLKLVQRIATVRHIAASLVLLGLIGTVVGFVIALGGVDPATASDVTAIAPMVSTLIQGMSVALYTTLVGAVLNIWLMLNYRLLEAGAVHLLTHLIEIGERHARA